MFCLHFLFKNWALEKANPRSSTDHFVNQYYEALYVKRKTVPQRSQIRKTEESKFLLE